MIVQGSNNYSYSGRRKKKLITKKKASRPFRELSRKKNPRLGENTYPSHEMKAGVASRNTIMDNLHKESEEVRQQILAKKNRLAPAYSKGAVQYITDEADPSHLGRKL